MNTNKENKCLLCGGATRLLEQNYPGYQEPETFDIHYCSHCNTSFSLPMVDTKQVYEQIYHSGEKLPLYERYWKYKNAVKCSDDPLQYLANNEEMYWAVKNTLQTTVKEKLKILEVGCGLGYLTYALVMDGYNTTGLDISQNAIDEAVKNFGNHYICADITEYARQYKGVYDIVVLTEVIEHVEDPVSFLQSLTELLKPDGGKIILTTPNKTIYPANIVWNTDLPPVHLWWFSEDSMRYIANKLNANIQFVDFTEYYKKKQVYRNTKFQQSIKDIKHVFSQNGEIIERTNNSSLRSLLGRISFIKSLYYKINPTYYKLEKKSWILGGIITKHLDSKVQN
jgi:2-polyprenyl-3-methyl-5-hydroxy-6-metoxy-1,4-benzoquinol methylase